MFKNDIPSSGTRTRLSKLTVDTALSPIVWTSLAMFENARQSQRPVCRRRTVACRPDCTRYPRDLAIIPWSSSCRSTAQLLLTTDKLNRSSYVTSMLNHVVNSIMSAIKRTFHLSIAVPHCRCITPLSALLQLLFYSHTIPTISSLSLHHFDIAFNHHCTCNCDPTTAVTAIGHAILRTLASPPPLRADTALPCPCPPTPRYSCHALCASEYTTEHPTAPHHQHSLIMNLQSSSSCYRYAAGMIPQALESS